MKKILVITRFDSSEKMGGDVNLMKSFLCELEGEYDCKHHIGIPTVDTLSNYDVVFCCNIDRPIEPYVCLMLCRDLGIPFVLYTLHHPYDGIRAYMRYGVRGSKKILSAISFNKPTVYENYLWLLKVAVNYKKKLPLGRVKFSQKQLLNKSDLIITCNKQELIQIEKDICPVSAKTMQVAHTLDNPSQEVSDISIIKNRIIVPGRIESRKNQIIIKNMIEHFPECEFYFIGSKSLNDEGYVNKLINFVGSNDQCHFMDALSEVEFYDFLATADVVFTASWFEVTSLIELQTISLGLKLVCSKNSYIGDEENVYKFNPEKIESAIEALKIALSAKCKLVDKKGSVINQSKIIECMRVVL